MALIKCKECGNSISEHAKSCPNCGCPIEILKTDGITKVKMPPLISVGLVSHMLSQDCIITNLETNKVIWRGKYRQIAEIYLEKSTPVLIKCGSMSNPLKTKLEPNSKYQITQDMGMHWNSTYNISKVDVIDAD